MDAEAYLKQFGYLESPVVEAFGFAADKAAVTMTGVTDIGADRVRQALRLFQAFVGIPVTGEMDDETVKWMESKRCGFPDVGSFVLHSNRWQTRELHYNLFETSVHLTTQQVFRCIEQALKMWSDNCGMSFKVDMNPDMRIRFVSGNHGDGFDFDGSMGVLAHAFFPPPNGGDLAGDLHMDDAERWTALGTSGMDLVTVAAHEFGHALGLAHSSIRESIMFPYFSGVPQHQLHADDIAGIQVLYGGRVDPAPPPVPTPPAPNPTPTPQPGPAKNFYRLPGSKVYHKALHVYATSTMLKAIWSTTAPSGLTLCKSCAKRS